MDRERDGDENVVDEDSTETRHFDASGTAHAASARNNIEDLSDEAPENAAALGLTGHMGESKSSPGLAGDLSPEDE
jgi:hypothetical protein